MFLNNVTYFKTVRFGCDAVAVFFSIYLKPVLYNQLGCHACVELVFKPSGQFVELCASSNLYELKTSTDLLNVLRNEICFSSIQDGL